MLLHPACTEDKFSMASCCVTSASATELSDQEKKTVWQDWLSGEQIVLDAGRRGIVASRMVAEDCSLADVANLPVPLMVVCCPARVLACPPTLNPHA